jgi:hypothetical protein
MSKIRDFTVWQVKSHTTGKYVRILSPMPELWTLSLKHRTQIVHDLDQSFVIFMLGLKPGEHIDIDFVALRATSPGNNACIVKCEPAGEEKKVASILHRIILPVSFTLRECGGGVGNGQWCHVHSHYAYDQPQRTPAHHRVQRD